MDKYSIEIPEKTFKGRHISAHSHIKKYLEIMKRLEERGKANPNNYTPVVRTEKIYSTYFSRAIFRQFYYLTFHMKRYSMHYDDFRLQMRNALFAMDRDIKELRGMSSDLEKEKDEPIDEVSLVIISNEADWLMTNLIELDRIYHRFMKSQESTPLDEDRV